MRGLTFFIFVGVASGACTRRAPREERLLVGRASDAIGLDPARISDAESVEVTEQIFEHLVKSAPDTMTPGPALATSWVFSSDGTEWTFQLRPGVRFHDGTPLDADAVVFSFERQRDPKHPFHEPDFTYESPFSDMARVEKVGPLAVRFVMRHPYAPLLADLSMFPSSIVSPAALAKWGKAFREHPVGTGPFRFVEWKKGERVTLAANPDYWDGPPKLSHLAFVSVGDPRQRLVKLEGGAIDVAENLAPQDLQFVSLHPQLDTRRASPFNVSYLAMNTMHPPFDDVRVRRAVAQAIDKDAIVRLVYQGLGEVATGPLPPAIWGHVEATAERPDPERARAVLSHLAGRLPHRPRLFVSTTPRPYLPAPTRVARMIAQSLHDAGLDVEIVANDIDAHIAATERGDHDLCLSGWTADSGDPDNVLYTLFHGDNAHPGTATNLSFFSDPMLDALLSRAQASPVQSERINIYATVQAMVADAVPMVPIANAAQVVAFRTGIVGLKLPPTGTLYFAGVSVGSRETRR